MFWSSHSHSLVPSSVPNTIAEVVQLPPEPLLGVNFEKVVAQSRWAIPQCAGPQQGYDRDVASVAIRQYDWELDAHPISQLV